MIVAVDGCVRTLSGPGNLHTHIRFHFNVGGTERSLTYGTRVTTSLPKPVYPQRRRPCVHCQSILPSSSLTPTITTSISLTFRPTATFRPLRPVAADGRDRGAVITRLGDRPSLLTSADSYRDRVARTGRIGTCVQRIRHTIDFVTRGIL